jgi:predicted cupin superfamily sugar epimerase
VPQGAVRAAGTSIFFLLPAGVESAWHRVKSDELWIHQHGDSLTLNVGEIEDHQRVTLGPDGDMQFVVPANIWQSARVIDGPAGYCLVCCVVVPGFDFADFEMA